MLGVVSSLLIGSQLRALLSTQCVGSAPGALRASMNAVRLVAARQCVRCEAAVRWAVRGRMANMRRRRVSRRRCRSERARPSKRKRPTVQTNGIRDAVRTWALSGVTRSACFFVSSHERAHASDCAACFRGDVVRRRRRRARWGAKTRHASRARAFLPPSPRRRSGAPADRPFPPTPLSDSVSCKRTVREPVRPRVTEQCVSSSLHSHDSASRGVAQDARQCERQCGLRNPQPIRRLETTPSIVTKKRPKAVRFGQCEPLPQTNSVHTTDPGLDFPNKSLVSPILFNHSMSKKRVS